MNALHAFYLLSTLGAVVFLFAGWALASLSKPKKPVEEQPALLNRVAQLELNNSDLQTLANTAQSQKLALDQQLELFREKLHKAEAKAAEHRASTNTPLAPTIQSELDQVLIERDRNRAELAQANHSLEQAKAELRARTESAKSRELAWEKDRAAFLNDRAANQTSQLRLREIPELTKRLSNAESQAQLAKDRFDTARVDLDTTREMLQQSNAQLKAAKSEADLARTESAGLKKKLAELISEKSTHANSTDAQLSQIKTVLDKVTLENQTLRKQLQSIQAFADSTTLSSKESAAKFNGAILDLKTNLQSARDENAQLASRVKAAETEIQSYKAIEAQLKETKTSLGLAQNKASQNEELASALFSLKTNLQNARDENTQLVSKVKAAESEVQNYKAIEAQLKETKTSLEVAQKKAVQAQELASALTETKESLRQAYSQLASLQALESELKDLRLKYQSTEAKANEVSSLREENRQLRQDTAELSNLSKTSAELDALSAEYRRVRLESELLSRRVEELSIEREKAIDMAGQVEDLENTIQELAQEKERNRILTSRLFALGAQNDEPPESISPISVATLQSGMQSSLSLLLQRNGIQSAVLADNAGLLVAGVGDESYNEGLAAMSGLVEGLVLQLRDLLPISHFNTVSLWGSHGTVVSTRLFPATDGIFAITTLGLAAPPADSVEKSIALLGRQIGPTDER